MRSLRGSFVAASAALALFGLGRFAFNLIAVREFGPSLVGSVGVAMSTWTVAAILFGTVPGFLTSKFVAECLARDEEARARRVFAAALGSVLIPGLVVATVAAALGPASASFWPFYMPVFGAYLVIKSAAFAFRAQRAYLVAELAGFGAFLAVCLAGVRLHDPLVAQASLLLQPAAIVAIAGWKLRDRMELRGAIAEALHRGREYGRFWGATFVNAAAGLVSYHLAVVIAGAILPDRAEVGYLSLMLSSLAPMNFVPTALGTSLFPELARRYGAGDEDGLRRAVSLAVQALQLFTITAGASLLVFPEPFLRLMHVPETLATRTTWVLLAWVLQVTMVSSPCGHFLNATRFAGRHALASGAFLAFGLAVGTFGLATFGLVGAGVMRVGVDAGLAYVRMAIAETAVRWTRGIRASLAAFQIALLAAMIAGLLASPWPVRIAVWALGAAAQIGPAMRLGRALLIRGGRAEPIGFGAR